MFYMLFYRVCKSSYRQVYTLCEVNTTPLQFNFNRKKRYPIEAQIDKFDI